MSGTLRVAARADVPEIQRVRHSVRENRLTSTTISDEDVVEAIERSGRGWVMEVDRRLVGFAVGNAETGNIWALFLEPEHERCGHGRRLHDEMVAWLWSRGLQRLWLTTAPGTRAERFYERAGWKNGGKTPSGELLFEKFCAMVNPVIDHDAIAREIKEAQDRGGQVAPFTSRLPDLSLPDAYDVAQRVRSMREAEGARPVGRKIGFTNASLWPIYDVHMPIWGYVYDTTLTRFADGRASCSLRGLAEPRIEPEIVLGLRSPVGAGASVADVIAAVEWIACGFEIVQTQFPGWKFKVADTVIDNGLHGRLVMGPTVPLERLGADPAAALASFTVELSRDGAHVESGKGANVLGSPLNAMAHLGAVVAAQGSRAALAAGEVVTTGTLTLAHPVRAGETWSFSVAGLPLEGLAVALTA